MSLERCRVVLVRPHYAGNIGSVARVMRNFGLRDLVLVDPVADHRSQDAVILAVHGVDVLESARVVPTLAEAVADCVWVVATSGEVGGVMRKDFWGTPEQQVPAVLSALDRGPAALVFGPEPSGLTVPEIAACHAMTFIPSDEAYPSLNLAQAAAVCLYELRRQWLRHTTTPEPADPPASFVDQERAYENLKGALTAVRFLWDFRGDGIFHVLRQVLVRGMPTRKELGVLHGLAKQLRYIAMRYGITHPKDGRPPGPNQDKGTGRGNVTPEPDPGFSPGGAGVISQGRKPLDPMPPTTSPGGATDSSEG
jgi:tRNA/rRNA methyltransferase